MGSRIEIAGKTDPGRKRKKNEDTFVIENDVGLMIVADGMGGHASGEVASQLASSVAANQLKQSLQSGHVPVFSHVPSDETLDKRTLLLGDCIKFSNQAVHEASKSNPANHNMGTTIVVGLLLDKKLAVGHVGDSRMYLLRRGDLTQITVDHSFVQEQVDKGLLNPEDAEKSDLRNMLTRSVGVNEDVKVDLQEVELQEGDYILICSDGLTKMLDDNQIVVPFQGNRAPKAIVDDLISMANECGGHDNVTVVIGKVIGNPSTWERVKGIFHNKGN